MVRNENRHNGASPYTRKMALLKELFFWNSSWLETRGHYGRRILSFILIKASFLEEVSKLYITNFILHVEFNVYLYTIRHFVRAVLLQD